MVTLNNLRWFAPAVLFLHASLNVASAQGGFTSLKTVHFDVQYPSSVTVDDAKKVADYLQSEYEYLNAKLGIDLKKRVEVRVYESVGRYMAESKQGKPWRGAIYSRGALHVQPVGALTARKMLEQALSFELAALVLEEAGRKGCPRWLREAFAVYHSGEMANLTAPTGVKVAYFSDLDQDIQQFPEPPQRDDVHYVLGMTMKFFIERFGEDAGVSVFKSFDGATSFEEVSRKVFKRDPEVIEREWAQYIAAGTAVFRAK